MCGQIGQFSERMTWQEYVELIRDFHHLQAILNERPPVKSYHTPTDKRCLVLLQEEPDLLQEGQFGLYIEYKGAMNWRFNILADGEIRKVFLAKDLHA